MAASQLPSAPSVSKVVERQRIRVVWIRGELHRSLEVRPRVRPSAGLQALGAAVGPRRRVERRELDGLGPRAIRGVAGARGHGPSNASRARACSSTSRTRRRRREGARGTDANDVIAEVVIAVAAASSDALLPTGAAAVGTSDEALESSRWCGNDGSHGWATARLGAREASARERVGGTRASGKTLRVGEGSERLRAEKNA